MSSSRHTGRRQGQSGTREAILAAARRQFAEQGYDRTSVRGIAQEAGVDPALVTHFHKSKQQLFLAVVELPFEPAEVLPPILSGDPDTVGLRLATFVVGVLESPDGRGRILSLVRAATSEPEAARAIRDLLHARILHPVADAIGAGDAEYRAGLVMSQVVGLTLARYIVQIEPLASMEPTVVVAAVAPTLQRYLTGPLGPPDAS